jgi:hypothetical protein
MYSRNVASESLTAGEFLCIASIWIGARRGQVDACRSEIPDPFARFPFPAETFHRPVIHSRARPIVHEKGRPREYSSAGPELIDALLFIQGFRESP